MAGSHGGVRVLSTPVGLAPLFLASASPRRSHLLQSAGWVFTVDPVDIDETPRPDEDPRCLALRLAESKALKGARRRPLGTVLGADTLVVVDDEILGKPRDVADARAMLQRLSGRTHKVGTAVALLHVATDRVVSDVAIATVRFDPLDDAQLSEYLEGGEWADKAGAYGIQGDAARFAHVVDGDWDTVVGLPMGLVDQLAGELAAHVAT